MNVSDAHIVVREATDRDVAALVDGNAAMALETEGKTLDRDRLLRGVRAALADAGRGRYLVASRADDHAGQLMLTREWSDWRNGWFWWIQSVYVRPAHRRCGVFRALYEAVVAEARSRGDVCGLRLYVEAENTAAQATYAALGMETTSYRFLEVDWT